MTKITYKIYIFITSSSSPGFIYIYIRTSHRIQRKKMSCHQYPGPVYNPWKFVATRQGMKGVGSGALAATVVWKRIIARITKDGKEVDRSLLASLSTLEKSRPNRR
jgi:hypothetical protein